MKKYLVLYSRKTAMQKYDDVEILGVYDTELEATEKAYIEDGYISDENRPICHIEVGEATDANLEDKEDWESFTSIDTILDLREH